MIKKILFLALAAALSGCAVSGQDSSAVRVRIKENPSTLDPAYIVDVAGGSIAAKLFNGLVRFDENREIVSDIAQSWDISEDGLMYTFRLREDTGVTPDMVKASFERTIAVSPRGWIFDKVKSFNAVDANIFRVELEKPFGPFLGLLAMPAAYISDNGRPPSVFTGPYVLSVWDHDQRIILKRNEKYFGDLPISEKIEYVIVPEEFSAVTEFRMGNLDIMEPSPIYWRELARASREARGDFKMYSRPGLNVYYIGLNAKKPFFRDIRVRQAFNYALDRNTVIRNILYGQAEPAWGPVPPALLAENERFYFRYLPNKAKRLLGDTVFSRPLKMYVRAQSQAVQIAEIIQYFLEAIGVPVAITPLEWSAFKHAVTEGEPDIFLMSWWADYPDPENFLFPTFHTVNAGAGGNRARFSHSGVDNLIEKAQRETDPAKREGIYAALQRYISRQAPWIFLWHLNELAVTQKNIDGFNLYPVYNSDKGTKITKRLNEK